MRHTKIICTLGPATSSYRDIQLLVNGGMDAGRFNMSHGTHESHLRMLKEMRKASRAAGRHVAAILDTKGLEIRAENTDPIKVRQGELVVFGKGGIPVNGMLFNYAKPGKRMLIDDGKLELKVVSSQHRQVVAKAIIGGTIRARKSISLPGTRFTQPFLSARDKADLRFAVRNGFDYIAASFTRSADDIKAMRSFLKRSGGRQKVIAKIENKQGVEGIDGIIREADGIMVARGDLGTEMRLEDVPSIQRMIVEKCVRQGKQVIIATQMLESMIENARPTRAEVGDIANAVWQGASAIMLSGETASGKHPFAALRAMAMAAEGAEKNMPPLPLLHREATIANAISAAIAALVGAVGIKAVICFTRSGFTAHLVSKERLRAPVVALTRDEQVARWLSIEYGVIPRLIMGKIRKKKEEAVVEARKMLKSGELFIVTYGSEGNKAGTTDTIRVLRA